MRKIGLNGERSRSCGAEQVHPGSEYTDEELAILRAAHRYRQKHNRRFLTIIDMVAVLKELGWKAPQ